MSEDKPKLTDKQEAFCQEYVKDYNATQAAIRAGYSENTAQQIGSENLSKLVIRERIDEIRAEIYQRNKVTIDEIVNGLGELFRVDTTEIFDEEGNIKPIDKMSEKARKAIKSIQVQTYTYDNGSESVKKKIELYSKLDAAEKLMKHLGGYDKDNQQKRATNVTVFKLPDNGRK